MFEKVNKKGGWRIDISETSSTVNINLFLNVAICNDSIDPNINLYFLANSMEQQMKLVYEISFHKNFVDDVLLRSG